MNVLVTGSRKWTDWEMLRDSLDHWNAVVGISLLIEGCAKGADSMAERWAAEWGIPVQHFPADWAGLGKKAGVLRNSRMLTDAEPELVIAFHDELHNSAGTGDMVHKARKWGLEVVVVSHSEPSGD